MITVCNDSICHLPASNATVTLNALPLIYNVSKQEYQGDQVFGPGATISLQISANGATYTASATQYSQFPTLLTPPLGASWNAGVANTVTWSPVASSSAASYFLWVEDSNTGKIVYPTGNKPLELPIGSISSIIPAGWTQVPGLYNVGVGIGTPGIGNSGALGLPISNAALGSGLIVGGIASIRTMITF